MKSLYHILRGCFVVIYCMFLTLFTACSNATIPQPTPTPKPTTTPTPTPTPPLPPPRLLQHIRSSNSGSTNTVSFPNTVQKGDVILVAITQFERKVSSTGVVDNTKNTYKMIDSAVAHPDTGQDYAELYIAQNVTGGATQIVVSFGEPSDSDGGDTNVGIYEFSGLSAASPLGDHASDTSNMGLDSTPTIRRVLNTSGMVVCFAVATDSGLQDNQQATNNAIFPGKGYELPSSDDAVLDAGNQERYYAEYAIVGAGGCMPNFTIGYPSYWAIIGVALNS